ncbi:MAG: hypothetical protein Q8R55_04290 [Candidatus Taylorbacteria bacterium]|nr:hypothetical protein [Candidatus Taylorbacteria bacterium]
MNFLQRIDALILSLFTKVSHKFQILTGRTNYFLAHCCLTLVALSVSVTILGFFFPIAGKGYGGPLYFILTGSSG